MARLSNSEYGLACLGKTKQALAEQALDEQALDEQVLERLKKVKLGSARLGKACKDLARFGKV